MDSDQPAIIPFYFVSTSC